MLLSVILSPPSKFSFNVSKCSTWIHSFWGAELCNSVRGRVIYIKVPRENERLYRRIQEDKGRQKLEEVNYRKLSAGRTGR